MDIEPVIASVAARLKAARNEKDVTLAKLSRTTGISVSTLSRLESGQRKPSLELLVPIVRALGVSMDELLKEPVADPRVRRGAVRRGESTFTPLSARAGGLQAYRAVLAATKTEPEQKTHEGFEWVYVLSGQLRLALAEHDIVMAHGEAAEFDTRVPHWLGSADGNPVELLILFGPQGERMHVRAGPAKRTKAP
ncbi:MAG: family transcriptional regulator [Nocardioidaceae bacterium]|nr:family transcriptional regulator [Nocardioidaceae bacterium]